MGMCCSDNSNDFLLEDFLKEQEQIQQKYSSLVKPHLVASMSKIYITQRPHFNVIAEEDSILETSTVPNSYLRFTNDGISKRSEDKDMSLNYESLLGGSVIQFNYIFGSKILIRNAHTNYYLNSHCLKAKKMKKGHEVSVSKDLSKQVYLEWVLLKEHGGAIQSGDLMEIEHVLTQKRLRCCEYGGGVTGDVCCNDESDEWRAEVLNKDGIVRIGCFLRIIHNASNKMLTHARKRAILKEQHRVVANEYGKFSIWQILLSE